MLVGWSGRAAAVTVISPAGTFLAAYPTPDPFIAWGAAAAEAPGPHRALAAAAGDSATPLLYERVQVPAGSDTAAVFNPTVFQLTRVDGDTAPRYVLSGTNGAWDFALRLQPAQAHALFAALRGDSVAGVMRFEYPSIGRTPAESRPMVTGAWLHNQVDVQVGPPAGGLSPGYPAALRKAGVGGTVHLTFIVDSTGAVRPSSVGLIGKAHPALALAAVGAILQVRYQPARRAGQRVAQLTSQTFTFRP